MLACLLITATTLTSSNTAQAAVTH